MFEGVGGAAAVVRCEGRGGRSGVVWRREVAGEDAGWELRDKVGVNVVVFGRGGQRIIEGALVHVGGFLA